MATLVFTYDHSRDPMNPGDLADRIAVAGSLSVQPQVDISPTQIIVTHPAITESNRVQIQGLINAYVLDPVNAAFPDSTGGMILRRLKQAQTVNSAFLALGPSPTAAQVRDQVIAATRELNGIIKLAINDLNDAAGT